MMSLSRVLLWAAIGLAVLIASPSSSGQQSTPLPQPYATRSVNNHPRVVPRPQNAELRVPPGFSVDSWAEGFAKPRFMLQGPGGEVLVAEQRQ